MNRILFLLALLCLEQTLNAQYIYTIKADSVKITNTCDTAELIVENHTQNVCGFLFNKGRGRTEFRRGLIRFNDSVSLIGCDTLKMNPWLQGGNRFGTIGSFGTMDNNPIDFYSNSIKRARLTNNGSFQIGNVLQDNGEKLQVTGTNGAVTILANLSRSTDRIQIGNNINSGDGQNVLFRTSNDNGVTYRNIMVERDGFIGLGTSDNPNGGWNVWNPALRIFDHGTVMVSSSSFYLGHPWGNFNSSCLKTYVSNLNEWNAGIGNYPNRQNYYSFGTFLGGQEGGNVRADLRVGGRNLRFFTGGFNEGVEAASISENQNLLIGTTNDLPGVRLHMVGDFLQEPPAKAIFGNTLAFDTWGDAAVINCYKEIVYKSENWKDQHLFFNSQGGFFKGTMVTMDPGYYPTDLKDTQVVLKVRTRLSTQSAPGLVVNMVGNMGLGIEIPSAQLHTTGSVRFAGLTSDNSQERVVVSDANGNLYYRTASSLGINETLNSDFAVNGRVSAQQMHITKTACWPDYVFSKHYKLPSLTELEDFINKNSHLPGIPSAAEVEKKGIDVGNNQAALLKKIEELTLYIIEQDKTIKKQNDQITDLLSLKKDMAELKALLKK